MFTHCPDCLATQAITPATLRDGRGMMRCGRCGALFDALATLTDTAAQTLAEPSPPMEPWRERAPGKQLLLWRVGVLLGVALLCVQLVYFEGGRVLQNPKMRPVLEKLCAAVHCHLPDYRNLAELSVLYSAVSELPNHHYVFKLVLNNESALAIRYPAIGLTLLTYGGQAFAHRVFQPREYLAEPVDATHLAAHAAAEISLEIAAPHTQVGGFHFDLSY